MDNVFFVEACPQGGFYHCAELLVDVVLDNGGFADGLVAQSDEFVDALHGRIIDNIIDGDDVIILFIGMGERFI